MRIIWKLRTPAGTSSVLLARELGVSKATVSVAVSELEADGYITKGDARKLLLTEKGREIAESVTERHDYFFDLLTALGVDDETADADACLMEHSLSESSWIALHDHIKVPEA